MHQRRSFILDIIATILILTMSAFAQAPPQIPLTGNIGIQGSVAILGGITVQMPSDANYTLTPAQWSNKTLKVTSAVSLSAPRNIVAPMNMGQEFNVENSTTGGQSITIIGASGAGALIQPGTTAPVFFDGTNYFINGTSYPTAIANQVWQYGTSTTVGPGGFLAQLDLPDCSTAYLYDEGAGSAVHNRCSTGSSHDGVIIGSPAWSQFGLVLNPNGTTGQAIQLPATENAAKTFLIGGYFPTWGVNEGVNWGNNSGAFQQNGSLLCGTVNTLLCTVNWNPYNEQASIADNLTMFFPSVTFGGATVAAQSIPTGVHVVTIVCGISGNNKYYVDGAPLPMTPGISACPSNTTSGQYQIGGSTAVSVGWKSILVGASMTFQAALNDTQVAARSSAMLAYLNSRGQQASITPAVSYKMVPTVTCFGDSRTAGVGSVLPLCTYVAGLDDSTVVINTYAWSGLRSTDMCSDAQGPASALPKIASGSIAILWMDINDAQLSGSTLVNGPSIIANDRCTIQKLKALGVNVFIATEIDATACSCLKNYVNGPILSQAKNWGADGIVALGSFPILAADGAAANTTYFANGLHPTILTDSTVISVAYANAVNEFWGSTELQHNVTSSTSYQELDKDGWLNLTAATAPTITLPDCQGYTRDRHIFNLTANAATILPGATGFYSSFTQTINGASSYTLPANASVALGIIPGPSTTGGCSWYVR